MTAVLKFGAVGRTESVHATPEVAKSLYFQCSNKDPNGIYATEVDLVEFAQAVERTVTPLARRDAETRCIDFVAGRNPELGAALKVFLGR